ncbi:CD276 antigen-like [Emydura macquarii macquarii]|uniref:CD276 antigen-like n=1 Tax=Emydura macquarii macquarii TaxID=1129001 RepID=UPI00352A2A4C
MKTFLAYWLHFPVLFMGKVQSAPDVVARFGGNVTLSCLFPARPGLDLQRLTLTWQKEREGAEALVVHSYYYGRDQLARQAEAYRNRTWLDPEGLAQGNAALTLRGVCPQDEGIYRCHVTSELGPTSEHSELRVGAPFSEPQLDFSLSSAGVTLTVHTGGGYPTATVQWLDEAGRDVTGEGTTEQRLDEQGLYQITSRVTVPPATHSARLTFLLTPRVLGTPITRPLSLELRPGLLGPPPTCLGGRLAVVCATCLGVILLVVAFLYCPRRGLAGSCSRRRAEEDKREALCLVPAGPSLQAAPPDHQLLAGVES